MNYSGIHQGYITINQRDSNTSSFDVYNTNTVTKEFKYIVGIGLFILGAVIGIFLGDGEAFSLLLALIFGLGFFSFPFFFFINKLKVTANKENIVIGDKQYETKYWEGFLIKETNANNGDFIYIYMKYQGVDYITKYLIEKDLQTYDIINQMNMLVN